MYGELSVGFKVMARGGYRKIDPNKQDDRDNPASVSGPLQIHPPQVRKVLKAALYSRVSPNSRKMFMKLY